MFENLDQNQGQNLTGKTTASAPGAGSNAPAMPAAGSFPAPKTAPVEDMFAGVKDIGAAPKMPGAASPAAKIPSVPREKSSGKVWGAVITIVIILLIIGLAIFIAGKFMGVEITNPSSWASKFSDLSGIFTKQSGQTMVINNVAPASPVNQNNVSQPAAPAVTTPESPVVSTPPTVTPVIPIATTSPVSPVVASSSASSSASTLDSDGDGLSDYDEINIYHTNPNKADSDNDGLTDYQEVKVYHTDPNNPDTDGDGYTDGSEVQNGYNPLGPGKLK